MTPLSLSCQHFTNGTLITICGELDFTNTLYLATYRIQHHPDTVRPLVLDLSGLTFLDSSGLQLLLRLHDAEHHSGSVLHLAGLQRRASRVLEITGVTPQLTIHPTIEQALNSAGLTTPTPDQPQKQSHCDPS